MDMTVDGIKQSLREQEFEANTQILYWQGVRVYVVTDIFTNSVWWEVTKKGCESRIVGTLDAALQEALKWAEEGQE